MTIWKQKSLLCYIVTLNLFDFVHRMFDSAQAHMYNEKAIGDALKESDVPREEIFLVSKVHPQNMGYEDTLSSVEESLAKFQVLQIQVYRFNYFMGV